MKLWRYGLAIERLGQRYRLDGVLGSGGMADVCLAWDEREEREVAVKVIKPDALNQRSLNRFLKEASHVAGWRHPNILRIYGDARLGLLDVAQGSIVPYIVMEYAQGGDLQKRLQPGVPYPFAETMHLFEQLCQAVSYAHCQGVIHRDLKPLNILFRVLPDQSEQMVLSDFGLAVEIAATHFTFADGGTLPYMAPEQLRGQAQQASDIFALGVILYQLCTGRYPFRRTIQDLRRRGPLTPPPRPSSIYRILPPELDDVIFTALNEDPADRYADALDFWEAINAIIDADTLKAISRQQSRPHISQPAPHNAPPPSLQKSDPTPILLSPAPGVPSIAPTRSMTGTRQTIHLPTSPVELPNSDPAIADIHTNTLFNAPLPSQNTSRPSRQRVTPPHPATPFPHRVRRNSRLFLWLSPLLLILLLGGLYFAYHSGAFLSPAPATITLVPASKLITNTYALTAVTTTPDPAQLQVPARQLIATSQSQPQTVQGTGHMQTPGSVAKGTLIFSNGEVVSQTVSAGTIVVGKDGVKAVTDNDANIPPINTQSGKLGTLEVPAHVMSAGTAGNIAIQDIDQTCCSTNNTIFVRNLIAFTGGQDPKDYMFVQQGDVDGIMNPLRDTVLQQAQAGLQKQMQSPFEPVGTAQCTNSTQVDPATVGDKGQNIPATTALLKVQCLQFAYDKNAARDLAQARLRQQAQGGYILVGNITTNFTVGDVSQQGVALQVQAQGRWTYAISPAQKLAFARLIAGKSATQARSILMQQAGIANVLMAMNGAQDDHLSTDPGQISINVQTE